MLEKSERIQWGSGVTRIDDMLKGGVEAGTITLITGPSGTGKSTLAALFVAEAARRGRNSAMFAFEEEVGSLLARCDRLEIPLRSAVEAGNAAVEQVEPLRYLSDEFALRVEQLVTQNELDIVVIDSLTGFELTLGESESTRSSLHSLVKSLARKGITVILVNEIEAVTGEFRISERGISYLADNVILMRYLESGGELQKVFGILKKRFSSFDRRLLPYEIGPRRIVIHEPEEGVHAILSGQHVPLATQTD